MPRRRRGGRRGCDRPREGELEAVVAGVRRRVVAVLCFRFLVVLICFVVLLRDGLCVVGVFVVAEAEDGGEARHCGAAGLVMAEEQVAEERGRDVKL